MNDVMRARNNKILSGIELFIIIVIILSFGWTTRDRNTVWKDDLSLWSDVINKSPDKARGYNETGMYFYTKRLHDKAIPFFLKSIMLDPNSAIAYNNLGLCYLGKGKINSAINEFQKAIQKNPLKGLYHINLGIAYWQKGLSDLAQREIEIGKNLKRRYKPKQPLYHHGQF